MWVPQAMQRSCVKTSQRNKCVMLRARARAYLTSHAHTSIEKKTPKYLILCFMFCLLFLLVKTSVPSHENDIKYVISNSFKN